MSTVPEAITWIDLRDQMPTTWQKDILSASAAHSQRAVLTGDNDTSLEAPGTWTVYRLLDGVLVRRHIPWLDALYRNTLVEYASAFAGEKMVTAGDERSGVNVNILEGSGSRYEWHVDSNPLTGLLFVTTHDDEAGGELVFRGELTDTVVHPRSGIFLLFDARNAPHTVKPLRRDELRVSVPMNFYREADGVARPEGLDEYLYSTQHEE